MDDNRQDCPTSNVRISIPSFRCLFDEFGKEYTVYKVNIAKPGGAKVIEKRYSEFFKLNKILKKHELPRGRNLEFPPKKLISSMLTKEERRKKLEKYLQILNNQDPIPAEVLNFLGISLPQSFIDQDFISHHQPVIGFLMDPFLAEQPGRPLNDILLDGVLDALYGDVIAKD